MAAFTSGSDGSAGALNVTADTTLPMPDDGIFHYTTINVAADATLTFTKNLNNTPVYLLATGDVTIAGTIDVSGQKGGAAIGGSGGPGGFSGGKSGNAGIAGSEPSDGYGPGAGGASTNTNSGYNGGAGSYAIVGATQNENIAPPGQVYGSQLLVPLLGGSGGGGGSPTYGGGGGGGGGGGAILISSTIKITVTGSIISKGGGNWSGNGYANGSGGAIRLVAPDVIGDGTLDVQASNSTQGRGRTRVDMYLKPTTDFGLTCTGSSFPSETCTLGSFMKVFIDNVPGLKLTEIAGNAVTTNGQYFELPFNAPATQEIKIESSNFSGDVNIRVKLTPVSGAPVVQDVLITKQVGTKTQVDTVSMDFPLNTAVRVNAWTIPAP